jgi:hypothetical protein
MALLYYNNYRLSSVFVIHLFHEVADPYIVEENQVKPAAHNGHASEADKQNHDEELGIQRKLAWFTGLLVAVGLLQGRGELPGAGPRGGKRHIHGR